MMKIKTEEVPENEDDKNYDQNMSDVKEEKPFLDKNLKDIDISTTPGLHQKISTDHNSKPETNNENINGNDLEEIKENSNIKLLKMITIYLKKYVMDHFYKKFKFFDRCCKMITNKVISNTITSIITRYNKIDT